MCEQYCSKNEAHYSYPALGPTVKRRGIVYLFAWVLATCPNAGWSAQAKGAAPADSNLNPPQAIQPELKVAPKIDIPKISKMPHTQILYLILGAELAAKRNQPNTALSYYLEAATLSDDPKIAEEATQMAIQLEDVYYARLGASRWAELAPNHLQAQLVATSLYMGYSKDKAFNYLKRALDIDCSYVIEHVATMQQKLSEKSNLALHQALSEWANQNPNNPLILVLASQSGLLTGDFKNAKIWIDAALEQNDAFAKAILLKAKMIRMEQHSEEKAIQFLEQKLHQFEKNAELRLIFANVLYEADKKDAAIQNLKKLIQDNDFESEAELLLGEIYLKQKNYLYAEASLKNALNLDSTKNEAQYLLGQLAEIKNKKDEAIRWYSSVEKNPYHVKAFLKAADLLRAKQEHGTALRLLHAGKPDTWGEQKQLLLMEMEILSETERNEEAFDLSKEIIAHVQNDTDILYASGILGIKTKNFNEAESTLNNLLKIDPNHTMALNAMGYMLSMQTNRLKEAEPFLERALTISPEEPALLDTMGWLQFRLENYEAALKYLKKAYQISADSEIAAHLGEVLWKLGRKEEAANIWKTALAKDPQHEVLLKVIQAYRVAP